VRPLRAHLVIGVPSVLLNLLDVQPASTALATVQRIMHVSLASIAQPSLLHLLSVLQAIKRTPLLLNWILSQLRAQFVLPAHPDLILRV
jgi:hypothetical protein